MGRGLHEDSKKIIEASIEILEEIQPAGVRAVCYPLFVTYKLIPSMSKANTNKVSGLLVKARERGLIPWDWIVDGSREAERNANWKDAGHFVRTISSIWARDAWQQQPVTLQVWSEKNTVKGTIDPVLKEYGVDFQPCHGFGSATVLHNAALDSLIDKSRPTKIIYIGDYDPSGLYMSAVDLPERLARYGGKVEVVRVALNEHDIRPGGRLPFFPLADKKTDRRHDWYKEHTSLDRCWELDALSPVILRSRLEEAIKDEIVDEESWGRMKNCQAAERESLLRHLNKWKTIVDAAA